MVVGDVNLEACGKRVDDAAGVETANGDLAVIYGCDRSRFFSHTGQTGMTYSNSVVD